ncbi:hypothetical protein MMC15_004021 [Xylographa vitiligo]|nr:hypothetical protein [Xylographa vitiligo]
MTLYLQISSAGFDQVQSRWPVHVLNQDNELIGSPRLDSLLSSENENDLKWCLTEFALQDPFSWKRAKAVEETLRAYGQSIAHAIKKSITSFLASIAAGDSAQPSIQSLHWEVLEDPQLWQRSWEVIIVSRTLDSPQQCSQLVDSHPDLRKEVNTLFFAARPGRGDQPYGLISKSVLQMITDNAGLHSKVNIRVARLGTWKILTWILEDERIGLFSLVHFDTHGVIKNHEARLVFTTEHSYADKDGSKLGSDIAKLLGSRGVQMVVLNACDSAKTSAYQGETLARILVREGVQNVVAISYPVMADSAELFVTALYYTFLLQGQGLSSAVALAWNRLRSVVKRDARFSIKVNVNDAFVPVLYQTSHELVLVRKPVQNPSQDLRLSFSFLYKRNTTIPEHI